MWTASVAEHPVRLVISVFLFTALTYPYELTRSNLCHQLKRKSRVWFPAKHDHLPRRVDRTRSRCDRYLREGRVVQKTLWPWMFDCAHFLLPPPMAGMLSGSSVLVESRVLIL